jgi:integrase
MAKIVLKDKELRDLTIPATGNRIDYDLPKGPRDAGFVRGFAVRTTAAGTKTFLLVYVSKDGQERRHRIGDYGPHTVTTARAEAARLRRIVDEGGDPFADAKAARAKAEANRGRDSASFGGLLTAYVDQLRRARKSSADKVAAELARTVQVPFPALWRGSAHAVTVDDLLRITGRLTGAAQWRQAEKTRAYLRAAYAACIASRGDAGTADLYAEFRHVHNIAADLGPISRPDATGENQADAKRSLSAAELHVYWKRIKAAPGSRGAILRFHLLTGAQRAEQLARLTIRQWDRDAGTVLLLDGKGRRKRAREHLVPLIPDAAQALEAMAGDAGPYLFTLDQGQHGAGYHTLRTHVGKIALAMVDAGEAGATFTPGELRITVETRLAAAGVSKDVRAQLQSHGLGGVQGKHYDRHDYLDEKRDALERLRALLEPGRVVKMPARKRA